MSKPKFKGIWNSIKNIWTIRNIISFDSLPDIRNIISLNINSERYKAEKKQNSINFILKYSLLWVFFLLLIFIFWFLNSFFQTDISNISRDFINHIIYEIERWRLLVNIKSKWNYFITTPFKDWTVSFNWISSLKQVLEQYSINDIVSWNTLFHIRPLKLRRLLTFVSTLTEQKGPMIKMS